MIDTTRALRIVEGPGAYTSEPSIGPARLIARDGGSFIVRASNGPVMEFTAEGLRPGSGTKSVYRLENEPIRSTLRYYARRSASNPNVIKLQETKPNASVGQIVIDVENGQLVGARLAS